MKHSEEMLKALGDMELALRLGNINGVVQGVFIWSQRGKRILNGEETWADQGFDPHERKESV